MSWEIEFDERENYLLAKVIGTRDSHNVLDITTELTRKSVECQSERLLLDQTESPSVGFNIAEIYRMASSAIPGITQRKIKKVAIYDYRVTDHMRFFQTVAQNRGHSVRYFTNEEEAVSWLLC